MTLEIFAVYDSKAGAHMEPFFAVNSAVAIRSFVDACRKQGTNFNAFPEDFTLFALGSYDQVSSKFELRNAPESLCTALSVMSEEN